MDLRKLKRSMPFMQVLQCVSLLHRNDTCTRANDTPKIKLQTHVSTAPGATARITTKAATIKAAATNAIKATLPRLAGNFPRMIQY